MIDFTRLDYLREGNSRQRSAYGVLTERKIIAALWSYDPVLVGTIPIDIDTQESDLDIICCFEDPENFENFLNANFYSYEKFRVYRKKSTGNITVVSNFFVDNFEIEIFGQNIPVTQQNGYRHMITEYCILHEEGKEFINKIRELKRKGWKTEPAFAKLLGLMGDPYESLLEYGEQKGYI